PPWTHDMTPSKRHDRQTTPASQGPTKTAPDVPIVADPPPVAPAPDAAAPDEVGAVVLPAKTKGDAGGGSSPPTKTGHVDAADSATTQRPRRPLSLYPLPLWPD